MNQGPIVQAVFTQEGRELFADITRNNVGRQLAIFLDGDLKSAPNIIEPILGGTAQITGNFTLEEAKELVRNLNIGALPVPISLASTETIGASLGSAVLEKGVFAFLIGLSLVFFFMLLWYRALGFIANIALTLYGIIMLSLFMYIPVTLTAAGIAGFILSIGMAVDANVLIFERLKEVLKKEESDFTLAIKKAFSEAWPAIRDGNGTSLISALVLFWLGTGMVQGFALVFGIGVVVSMISAILITRIFLLASASLYRKVPFLFKSGFLDK
jgi:preprotein translocase subunit SecD